MKVFFNFTKCHRSEFMCCNKYFLLERILGLEHVWKYVKRSLHLPISSLRYIYHNVKVGKTSAELHHRHCTMWELLNEIWLTLLSPWKHKQSKHWLLSDSDSYMVTIWLVGGNAWHQSFFYQSPACFKQVRWAQTKPQVQKSVTLGNHYSSYFGRSCLCSEPITIC